MKLAERIAADLKHAMKARDTARVSALRMLRTALLNREKSGTGEAEEGELFGIVRSLIKQRKEAVQSFREAGRLEDAEREEADIPIFEAYLPAGPNAAQMAQWVTQAIDQTGATTPREMGKVMGILKKLAEPGTDMGQLAALVKARLAS